jgi:hypothetical protein
MSETTTSKDRPERSDNVVLWASILAATDTFLNDLDCLSEMFSLVAPALKSRDEERNHRIKEIAVEIEKDGKKGYQLKSAEDAKELIGHFKRMRQGDRMFRQSQITSIVSRFDEFFIEVLKAAYQQNTGWLKNPDKKVTYKELLEIESFEDFKKDLIRREVDLLMRDSHSSQIEFLDSKLKLGVTDNFARWKDFLEITERRNLFVHTGGRVSTQYLENCNRFGITVGGKVKEGGLLSASDDYINKAIDVLYEIAVRIGQAAVRRLFTDSFEAADNILNNTGVELLTQERWDLAERIFAYALDIPQALRSSGELKYYFLINLCIALKFGEKAYIAKLESENWTPFHPKYHLAVAVLKDDYDLAQQLMRSQAILEQIREPHFKSWPLFRSFRSTPQFEAAFREVFQKDIAAEIIQDAQKEIEAQLEQGDAQQRVAADPLASASLRQASG